MKKLTVAIGVTVILALGAPLAALAASFQWNINVTNSASSAYSNVPFTAPISTASWISSNYIQSNGLDVQIMDGTTALPTEVTDTGLWWVGNINKNTTKTFTLSTGNTPATSMPIIVGNGGYLTTPYNSSLELENGWEIDIPASYINTSDVGAYILNKSGEVTIKITADKELIASTYDGTAENIVLTGINSGVYGLSLALNSGTLTFIIGTHSGTIPVGTMVNNTNDWIWDSDGAVMPYINSIVLKKNITSSVLVGFVYVEKQTGGTDAIYKLNSTDLSNTGLSWVFPGSFTAYPHSMCSDGTYVYIIGQDSTDTEVFKIAANSMTTAGTHMYSNALLYGGSQSGQQRWYGQGTVMVEDGGNLFLIEPSVNGSPQTYPIDEIDTTSMGVIGGGGGGNQAIACSGGYLYSVFDGVEVSGISKYSESDLSTAIHTVGGFGTTWSTVCDIAVVGNIIYIRRTVAGGGTIYTYYASTFASYGVWSAGYSTNDDGISLTADGTDLMQLDNTGVSGYQNIKNWFYNNDTTPSNSDQTWTNSNSGSGYALSGDGINYVYVSDSGHVYQLDRNSTGMPVLNSIALAGTCYNIALSSTTTSTLTQILKYAPNAIIQGTVLPDLSLNGYNGVITWGTNPSSTLATFGGFMPVTTATAPVGGGGGSPTSQYPGGMPPLTSEGNFSNIPGAGAINPILNSSDIPLDFFWDILIFVGILALGFVIMVWTKEIWIVGVACSVGFAIFSYNTNDGINFTGGPLPFWTVIVCIMATIVVGIMQDRGVIKI